MRIWLLIGLIVLSGCTVHRQTWDWPVDRGGKVQAPICIKEETYRSLAGPNAPIWKQMLLASPLISMLSETSGPCTVTNFPPVPYHREIEW